MLKEIYNLVRNRLIWIRVLSYAEKSDFFSAKQAFSKMKGYRTGSNTEIELMKTVLDFHLKLYQPCLKHFKLFRESLHGNSNYSNAEKNYLQCYGDRILNELKVVIPDAADEPFMGDFNAIDKKSICNGIKLNFPLSM
ncbi:MAG: hypothetical protein CSA81_03655 [Acidobacteria bacterium]|nr:MAG: hypothetical protein CSA81_03655 [Acidobacteriota bacterium]